MPKTNSEARPGFTFFPADWQSDPGLRSCSLGARGLWIEMMCLMHKSPRYGYMLMPNGDPISIERLALLVSAKVEDVSTYAMELKAGNVYSVEISRYGAVKGIPITYSRKMVRDVIKRCLWRELKKNQRHKPKNVHQPSPAPCPPVPVPDPVPVPKEVVLKHMQPAVAHVHQLQKIWQEEHGQLPDIRAMSRGRLVKCDARMKSNPEQFLADFRESVRRANTIPFYLGKSNSGWKATFDYFIENDTNYLKVLESNADRGVSNGTSIEHRQAPSASKSEQRHERAQQAIESALGHRSKLADSLRQNVPATGVKP